jgi:hypothetical protein
VGRVKFSASLNSVQGSIFMELNSVFLIFALVVVNYCLCSFEFEWRWVFLPH